MVGSRPSEQAALVKKFLSHLLDMSMLSQDPPIEAPHDVIGEFSAQLLQRRFQSRVSRQDFVPGNEGGMIGWKSVSVVGEDRDVQRKQQAVG